MIADALRDVGAARSIVIDESDTVLAGNGVLEAAKQAGIERVRVIETDGQTIVAVRRRGLSDEQKRKLAIYDNRAAELAAWDVHLLRSDRDDGLDLKPFWTDDELATLIGKAVSPQWTGMPEFDQQDETAFRTIKVHFEKQSDVDAFAQLLGQTVTDKTRYLWFPQATKKTVEVEFVGASDESSDESAIPDLHREQGSR